ncbi:MAG: hypothetical protein BWZ10_02155 [candidate division BRC1 bacterium ADurb.BinA364]|nr:MAG: hypothetical protein BWZ10_02155 [candidate division BRC1 bacterium ADurb.BinA364]
MAEQRRGDGYAVDRLGPLKTRQFRRGGPEIDMRPHKIAGRSRSDSLRPANNHRGADAAFVEIALAAAQSRGAVEFSNPRLIGPVVAGEKHNGVFVQPKLLKQRHQTAEIGVQPRDHRRVILFLLCPWLVGIRFVARNLEFAMGNRVGQIQEKRLLAMEANEIECLLDKQIVGIDLAVFFLVLFDFLTLAVSPEIIRIIIVRMHLIEIAIKEIEAVQPRHSGGVFVSQAPFADAACSVSGFLECGGDGSILGAQGNEGRRGAGQAVVAPRAVAGVQAGHQSAARRRANRAAGIALGKAHALGGQPVDIGRPNRRLAVAAHVADAHVVRHQKNDVRFLLLRRNGGKPFPRKEKTDSQRDSPPKNSHDVSLIRKYFESSLSPHPI